MHACFMTETCPVSGMGQQREAQLLPVSNFLGCAYVPRQEGTHRLFAVESLHLMLVFRSPLLSIL